MTESACFTFLEDLRSRNPHVFGLLEAYLEDLRTQKIDVSQRLTFFLSDLLYVIITGALGTGGGAIVPLSELVKNILRISNQTVSFLLDDIHFGSGILVGPQSVLTAAHLFFESDGRVIDRNRLSRVTAELQTTYFAHIVAPGEKRPVKLASTDRDEWLIDPKTDGEFALRDVDFLDFAIVQLAEPVGKDLVGFEEPRGWIAIPKAEDAPLLVRDLPLQVFEFLDRQELRFSSGFVRDVTTDFFRVFHTASTLDSSSGSGMFDLHGRLAALHVAGSASGERPPSNRALPIRRVAEVIDESVRGGPTIRARIK